MYEPDSLQLPAIVGLKQYIDEFILQKKKRKKKKINANSFHRSVDIVEHSYLHQDITMFTKIYSSCVHHSMIKGILHTFFKCVYYTVYSMAGIIPR